MAAADDWPAAVASSDMIGLPMGQLRTANKRRNRALDRATVKQPATTPAAAPAKVAKSRTAKGSVS